MKTVTTIHLNGRAYQVEDEAHAALIAYLEKAGAALNTNPDKDEILADFEQAIAEKLSKYIRPNKNVITHEEIKIIIAEMGPVEGTASENENAEKNSSSESGSPHSGTMPKRLYRIKEGAVIAGVCNGIAAYFNIDVVLVRVGFVILTIASHGAGLLAYFIMMMIIPKAGTEAERAAAQGMPFTAYDLLEQAKKNYAEYKGDKDGFKRRWKDESKYWKYKAKREMHEMKRQHRQEHLWAETLTGIIWFCIIIGLCILAYQHIPFFHYNFDRFGHWLTVKFGEIKK